MGLEVHRRLHGLEQDAICVDDIRRFRAAIERLAAEQDANGDADRLRDGIDLATARVLCSIPGQNAHWRMR